MTTKQPTPIPVAQQAAEQCCPPSVWYPCKEDWEDAVAIKQHFIQSAIDSELTRYRIALADAIRRPMGVVPDSANGLITQEELDSAEERRCGE